LTVCVGISASAGAEPLRIGVGGPFSGPDAVFGTQIRTGVEQAVSDINDAGGFLGRKAQVVAGDDGADPKKATQVAKGFVESGITLVIGHFSSAVTLPTSAIYAKDHILNLVPSATAPSITEQGLDTVFRVCGRADQQAAVAAQFLLGRHAVAIVHDRTSAGQAFADGVRGALAAGGKREVFYGAVGDTSDLAGLVGLVGRLQAAGTQTVVWGGGPAGAAALARQLRDGKSHIALLGGVELASDEFANLSGAAAEGVYVIFPRDPRMRPAAADLRRRLIAKNIEPLGYMFYAYAAVQIIKQTAQATHSLDTKVLAAAMRSGIQFETVLGTISFDAKGDQKVSDLTVNLWRKGPSGRMGFGPAAS
jgi:branched-chain amino acid transport system substrate-binding protein